MQLEMPYVFEETPRKTKEEFEIQMNKVINTWITVSENNGIPHIVINDVDLFHSMDEIFHLTYDSLNWLVRNFGNEFTMYDYELHKYKNGSWLFTLHI